MSCKYFDINLEKKKKGGRDLQIMLDALCSKDGIMGSRKLNYAIQDVPLYWSNVSALYKKNTHRVY